VHSKISKKEIIFAEKLHDFVLTRKTTQIRAIMCDIFLERAGNMEKNNKYRIVVLILIFCEIFCVVHIPSHDMVEHHHRDAQITKEAARQIFPVQMQELSEVKEVRNVKRCICENTIFFEIAKFAYEITKVHVYIWQLPRENIGGIMIKTN
jgi:hypothetical protein